MHSQNLLLVVRTLILKLIFAKVYIVRSTGSLYLLPYVKHIRPIELRVYVLKSVCLEHQLVRVFHVAQVAGLERLKINKADSCTLL